MANLQESLAPEVLELHPAPSAVDVFRALSCREHCLFLDSALPHPRLGRYSYVAADPFAFVQVSQIDADPLGTLAAALAPLTSETRAELPAFQGGAAGLFGYELGRSLESLPPPRRDDFHVPLLAVGLYDVVVAFDHRDQRAWIISQGWPAQGSEPRRQRARQRLDDVRCQIVAGTAEPTRSTASTSELAAAELTATLMATNHAVPGWSNLLSNLTREQFCAAVERAIQHIYAGDIFQVNLAQRLLHPASRSASELYLDLRRANPAPFAGYFDAGDWQIASASPERFLQVHEGHVETRPIKGTRPRHRGAEADLFTGDDLRASQKDRAENVMIVDLMRNDLSRVCQPDSVVVTQLCQLETYQYVQHLVSAVSGQLSPGQTAIDLLRATFPGGSITGAPKIRAMEIIADIEPDARGAYCGSLGYLGWDGAMDLSILIRTITAAQGWWQFPVGAGIVAQSDPLREYEETWHKAEGLLRGIMA